MGNKYLNIITGMVIGVAAIILATLGNPANMGLCIACFLRDIAGGLGLHRAGAVQYIRPEIIGIILGSFLISLKTKEFKSVGGSSTMTRFILGFFMMIGMLIFLGCPLRIALRLGAGDLNALIGFVGLFFGVFIGTQFLKNGFSLGRFNVQAKTNGYIFPLLTLILLLFVIIKPAFIFFSQKGPGAQHAPLLISLGAGFVVGFLAQRSRLCLAGGIRDVILFRNFHLISGFFVIFGVVLLGNLILGNFKLGFENQPIAHTETVWNFLGMALAGWAAALLGGCPIRQLILAGEGNTDAVVTVLGLLTGAAFAHNFMLAASSEGVPVVGKWAVIIGFIVLLTVSLVSVLTLRLKERSDVNANC